MVCCLPFFMRLREGCFRFAAVIRVTGTSTGFERGITESGKRPNKNPSSLQWSNVFAVPRLVRWGGEVSVGVVSIGDGWLLTCMGGSEKTRYLETEWGGCITHQRVHSHTQTKGTRRGAGEGGGEGEGRSREKKKKVGSLPRLHHIPSTATEPSKKQGQRHTSSFLFREAGAIASPRQRDKSRAGGSGREGGKKERCSAPRTKKKANK